MATDKTVMRCFAAALWDPKPTKTDLRARQLAAALGYPETFRVVRTIEDAINAEGNVEKCIVDRIYSAKPGTGCDMWYHHEAAQRAVIESWDDEESTPHQFKGGHLLPRQPLFTKGDKVQAFYENEWWNATITRRKEHPEYGFLYGVHYPADGSKQSGVEEAMIRRRKEAPDPKKVALELGFGTGWEATVVGKNRWKITAPDGVRFNGQKKAMDYYNKLLAEKGDPPWRTTGSDYLNRRVVHTIEHKPSSRRTVQIEQIGTVTGWISERDIDSAGEPGFVSDKTGQPAPLYHVDFNDDPHSPYASLMLKGQDFEEYELQDILVAEDGGSTDEPPNKKARTS